jgi:hypothetical protein
LTVYGLPGAATKLDKSNLPSEVLTLSAMGMSVSGEVRLSTSLRDNSDSSVLTEDHLMVFVWERSHWSFVEGEVIWRAERESV